MRTRIGALALVLGAAAAWTSPAAAQDAEQNKALFTVVVNQVFNHGDLALADDLIAKNVTHNGSPQGRDSFKKMVTEQRQQTASAPYNVADVVADGDRVVGRLTRSGGAAEIMVLKIRDGQVTEYWSMADEPSLRAQFGLNAPVGTASAPN
jgi:predicted ester cyclase